MQRLAIILSALVLVACGGGGGGGTSNPTACLPPATPTGLIVVPQYSDVRGHHNLVSWNPVPLGNYSWVHYNLYRTDSPTISIQSPVVRLGWPVANADDKVADTPFQTYINYYAVTATNECGESAISDSVLADGSSSNTPVGAPEPAPAPAPDTLPAPINLKVTKTGDFSWQLSWDPVNGADEYFVYERARDAPEPTRTSGRYTFGSILDDSYYYDFVPYGTSDSDSGTVSSSGIHCWAVAAGNIDLMDTSESNYNYVGKLSADACVYFPATDTPPPAPAPSTGQVSIWTNSSTTISSVSIDNSAVGSLTSYFASGAPTCGQSGTITKTLPVGTHSIKASNSSSSWGPTNVAITAGNCTMFKLTGSNTAPPPTGGGGTTTGNGTPGGCDQNGNYIDANGNYGGDELSKQCGHY